VGDIGGRALFNQHPINWVDWDDPHQNLDIDTPEDYQKFLRTYRDG
jgi:CTP:molybdopterin cytidylyltransferase MocA